MGSHESEQTLTLLSELSMLKKLDGNCEGRFETEAERNAHKLRRQRQQEIAEDIKALGKREKSTFQ